MKYTELILAGALSLIGSGCNEPTRSTCIVAEYDGKPAVYFFKDKNNNGPYDSVVICGVVNHHGVEEKLCQREIVTLQGEELVSGLYHKLEEGIVSKVAPPKKD